MGKTVLGLIASLASIVLAGCGAAPVGSCVMPNGGAAGAMTCTEFQAGYTPATAMQACQGGGQTFSTSGCASASRIGHCTFTITAAGASYTPIGQSCVAPDVAPRVHRPGHRRRSGAGSVTVRSKEQAMKAPRKSAGLVVKTGLKAGTNFMVGPVPVTAGIEGR